MGARLQTLNKEIDELRKLLVLDPAAIETKYEEVEKLQRNIKYKTEDARARFERRQRVVLGPVLASIGKALQEYAKLKGYALIFDVAKDENGLLIAIGYQSVDVTKDFVAFYNAKP